MGAQQGSLPLFPGMAAAASGMGLRLAGQAAADGVFAEFSAASGVGVARLACAADDGELHRDRSWELAVVATEFAAAEAYRAAGGKVAASLGFSIGAYAAPLCAGAVSIDQVVTMIDIVLEASLELEGRFAMLAVVGTSAQELEGLCRPGEAEVAAVLVSGQTLVADREGPVHDLEARVRAVALSVKELPVRRPLHTSPMKPVARELERRRAEVGELRPFRIPVYSALHGGRIEDPLEGWRLLVEHLFRPQRFVRAFDAAQGDGLVRCAELGPGGTIERAVRWLGRPAVEVETFPGEPDRGPRRKTRC